MIGSADLYFLADNWTSPIGGSLFGSPVQTKQFSHHINRKYFLPYAWTCVVFAVMTGHLRWCHIYGVARENIWSFCCAIGTVFKAAPSRFFPPRHTNIKSHYMFHWCNARPFIQSLNFCLAICIFLKAVSCWTVGKLASGWRLVERHILGLIISLLIQIASQQKNAGKHGLTSNLCPHPSNSFKWG